MTMSARSAHRLSRKAQGRRPSRKSAATRQTILDAAASLFAERGYGLTTLNDIAESVGIHLTGLYYYHDSKEQLASDIIASNSDHIGAALQEAIASLPVTAGPLARISQAIDTYLDCIHAPENLARAAARITSQISSETRDKALEGTRENNGIWRALIEAAMAEGSIRSDLDPTMIQMALLGSMNWTVEWFDSERGSPAPFARVIKAAFLEGLAS